VFFYAISIYLIVSLILFNIVPSGVYTSENFYLVLFFGFIAVILHIYLKAPYLYVSIVYTIKKQLMEFSDTIKYFIDHFLDLRMDLLIIIFKLFGVILSLFIIILKVQNPLFTTS